jgi:hypothetical protein
MTSVLLNAEIWCLVCGRTREEAQLRAETTARALNRDRAN